MSCNHIVIESALLVFNGVSMRLRSGRKNKLSWIKQLLALEPLQIALKPGKETKLQPLHHTLNTKVARRSITSQLCLLANGLVWS